MSRKRNIKEIIAAIGVILLLGGIIAIPATVVLTLYFPEVEFIPVASGEAYNWTRVWIVPPGQMNFVPVFLGYGEGVFGVYASNIRVNAYIMDVFNFFQYVQGATFFTPILKGQPSEYSAFGYSAPVPGFYFLVIENYSPYPALIVVEGKEMANRVLPTNNFEHQISMFILHVALGATIIGGLIYLPFRISKYRAAKKSAKKKIVKEK
ncbi:MAG: hypothetical protein ACUVXA_20585 [Candidatus Jordarchaeum sp.]|uniref:hypothetical protein n=1 Tax=Candidatus Jordarchaeum sp. TaxID=2823881 RepID=UPI00404A1E00